MMQITLDEEETLPYEFLALLTRAAKLVLEREHVAHESLEASLSFAEPDEMAVLNAWYRGMDEPTDVLSFPMYESVKEFREAAGKMATPAILGDIIICGELAELQAEEYGHSTEREQLYLFVHSMFHLLGYDHESEDERRAMRAAEKEIMSKLDTDSIYREMG